ncbi:haloacid dehalogenase type II [Streptomyces sp. NPDC093094]|uniref:haloacid dehalogenase type II n=1 Tax=Streptomyces sp. NPDC093094 TaxID=3366026 RepID=UPI00381494EF
MAAGQPQVLVFDVNETLSDLAPLRGRFGDVGAPGHLLPTWFTGVPRDGFALTAAGGYADFASLAHDGPRTLLSRLENPPADGEAAARHILDGFSRLDARPDVPDGIRKLSDAGYRLTAMTNGSAAQTEQLLDRAGVLHCFETLSDVGGPCCWKPAPVAYRHAVERAGVRPGQAMPVAVHLWDIDGVRRAGLHGAWLRRGTPACTRGRRPRPAAARRTCGSSRTRRPPRGTVTHRPADPDRGHRRPW